MKRIGILGEFTPSFRPHIATGKAIEHAAAALGVEVAAEWVSTGAIDGSLFERFSAIWVAPGSPYRNLERTLSAIRYARENNVPCFGTCGGFQHMVLEYARNVLGFQDAHHAEYDPYASDLFVSALECSLAGREMRITLVPGSRVASMYGAHSASEEYYCDFGVNPARVPLLKSGELRVTGSDAEGEIRVIELPHHPFFLGTLYVPQTRSAPGSPHPVVTSFLRVTTGQPESPVPSTVPAPTARASQQR